MATDGEKVTAARSGGAGGVEERHPNGPGGARGGAGGERRGERHSSRKGARAEISA